VRAPASCAAEVTTENTASPLTTPPNDSDDGGGVRSSKGFSALPSIVLALRYTLSYADPATYADWAALHRSRVWRLTKLGSTPQELRRITDCHPVEG